jgi:hypothetical protein
MTKRGSGRHKQLTEKGHKLAEAEHKVEQLGPQQAVLKIQVCQASQGYDWPHFQSGADVQPDPCVDVFVCDCVGVLLR